MFSWPKNTNNITIGCQLWSGFEENHRGYSRSLCRWGYVGEVPREVPKLLFENTRFAHAVYSWQEECHQIDHLPNPRVEAQSPLKIKTGILDYRLSSHLS